MRHRHALWPPSFPLLALLLIGLLAGSAWAAPTANNTIYLPLVAGTAPLLAPDQTVGGHTLEQAARLTAAYNVSLDPARYPPGLPYQVLNASHRSFTVPAGTFFYAPIAYPDDSPPIIGAFPTSASEAAAYFFGRAQLGGHDCFIEIDGIRYALGPEYLSGPVTTDPLPDGGGTRYLTLAAFMQPLSRGEHTVSIGSSFNGDAVLAVFGGPLTAVATYSVIVE
jgi:hypothetical protein